MYMGCMFEYSKLISDDVSHIHHLETASLVVVQVGKSKPTNGLSNRFRQNRTNGTHRISARGKIRCYVPPMACISPGTRGVPFQDFGVREFHEKMKITENFQ